MASSSSDSFSSPLTLSTRIALIFLATTYCTTRLPSYSYLLSLSILADAEPTLIVHLLLWEAYEEVDRVLCFCF